MRTYACRVLRVWLNCFAKARLKTRSLNPIITPLSHSHRWAFHPFRSLRTLPLISFNSVHIPQTTVEDALNLIHRYNNTIHSTHSNYYIRFYALLLKLYNDSPVARSGILQLLIEKLKNIIEVPRTTPSSQLASILNLDSNCMNGSIQQPIHELIATTALILHPVHPISLISTDEQRFQELSK